MSFIRELFGSRRPVRRQQEPEQAPTATGPSHALDTLPTLPATRRPITPPTSSTAQLASPFFRLPPELRQQIYRLVLSGREIHIDLRYTAVETTTPHSTHGASFDVCRRWRWRASNCHRHPDAPPIADRCGWGGPPPTACILFNGTSSSSCAVGPEVLALLRSCRLAYREAIEVLYADNTFHVCTGALLLYTPRLLPPAARAVTSLIFQVTEESVWMYADEHLGIEKGLPAYEVLLRRLPVAFPSLVRLLVVVQGSLWRGRPGGGAELSPVYRDAVKDCLLSSMDGAVAGFRRPLVDCVLAMRESAFDRVMVEERAAAEKVELREGMWVQFWRAVSVVRGDQALDTGYWVRGVAPEESELVLGASALALLGRGA
ncbi:hypothetical protein C8A00DRAFT_31112 [Chaetomidium leptoderma]|uniref:DUF7730 domain-containing protein n=1 Tax=Chaetomidium leptoderma TaxID=669021 RepID=A0AAN6VQQ4_9PEZI|nr:hypothetical protein C8A00DRAFT_31112 [Chaetomidium leptoderma]